MKFKPLEIYGTGEFRDEKISFEADPAILLRDYDAYSAYVKGCEEVLRNDDRYVDYIAELKQGGLNKCAIMGNLPTDDPKLKIEMHHGPIFNLFDYCDIMLKALLNRGKKDITSFEIADRMLTEHENHNVMVVMLSKPVHMGGVHNRKSNKWVFLDVKATWGRIDRFIEKWSDGMESEHFGYINRYLRECKNAQGNSLDQGLFDVAEKLKSFK